MAFVIAGLVSAIVPLGIKAAQNYSIRYGPRVTNEGVEKGEKFTKEAHAAREPVREKSIANYRPVTDDELQEALGCESQQVDLMDFSDDEAEDMILGASRRLAQKAPAEPKTIRLCCMTIRASRDLLGTEAFGGPLPLFSHWLVEVDGVYYELRDPRNANFAGKKRDGRIVLHQELGQVDRSIKLEITTNRKLHDSTRYFDVGTTILQREQIIRIASLVFRRFGEGYDIWVDNCQLFCQLLAEIVGGKENTEKIQTILKPKSLLKLPIAASWVAAPAYHIMATLHHALPKSTSPGERSEFCVKADQILEKFEEFFYHPRIYAARRGIRS